MEEPTENIPPVILQETMIVLTEWAKTIALMTRFVKKIGPPLNTKCAPPNKATDAETSSA